jgi:hypothetical protein
MKIPPAECLRCRGRMEQGFIFDFIDDSRGRVAQWMAGAPVSSFWKGVKGDLDQTLPIGAFRCATCGLLELYAGVEFDKK